MRRSDIAAIGLGVIAILIAIMFAVTGQIPLPLGVVLLLVVIAAVLFFFREDLLDRIDRKREERVRKHLRSHHNLTVVSGAETDASPEELPNRSFGYEEIFAVAGLKDGRARVKPAHDTYPLEVHKVDGAVYLIGFVSEVDRQAVDSNLDASVILWMRPQKAAPVLMRVPLARVETEKSRGDGTLTNPFRLILGLRPSASE